MSPHAAQMDEAIAALWLMIGWHGGHIPVYSGAGLTWHDARAHPRTIVRMVRGIDERRSQEVAFGLPQAKRWNGGVTQATVLWCAVSGSDQLRRARAFRPLPSLVLQDGSTTGRLLLWSLREALGYFDAETANRKIAYALHAIQKGSDPDRLRIPAPGTCRREGRSRPVPVVVARLTTADYTARQIAGRLREPPPKDAWMQNRA